MCGQVMLAVTPLRSSNNNNNNNNNDGNNREGATNSIMETSFSLASDEFPDFSGANLLDSIDFDDLFMGMHDTDDMLPDLEMDPELLAEFSISGGEESEANYSSTTLSVENVVSPNSVFDGNLACLAVSSSDNIINDDNNNDNNNGGLKVDNYAQRLSHEEVEIESKKKDPGYESGTSVNSSLSDNEKGNNHHNNKKHKSSTTTKTATSNHNNQGKRKTKVDWTPELHRRFVQAVEQLGVDKAVPSRILELMGIDCLTRHNIASHLQKYRSHRKHLLAREAEAATWTQKRQMYGVAMGGGKGGATAISPWHPPTVGFPPITPMHHPFRPLHVWGHPTMDPQARVPMWPKQVIPSPTPLSHAWPPHPPPADPAFWHSSHHRRLAVPPVAVPGVPPLTMYRPEHRIPTPVAPQSGPQNALDHHPSKESIDAALGDVLAKPWLPLPIGLKPPSMDTVFVELQRHGVSKIPPSCA